MSEGHQSACGDPVFERLRPAVPDSCGWAAPLTCIDVRPHEVRADIIVERQVLVLMSGGSAQLDCGFGLRRVACDLEAGAMGFFNAGTELRRSRWRWRGASRIVLDLTALGSDRGESGPSRLWPDGTPRLSFHDDALANLLRGLATEAVHGHPHGRLFSESLLLGLLQRLQLHVQGPAPRERGRLSIAQMRLLADYVESGLGEPLRVADLARVVGFSPVHFVRLLKNTVGLTPHHFVLSLRLTRARDLVLRSPSPLSVVAQETGFSSQSHMTRAFVRHFGVPPGVLRRMGRREHGDGAG